VIGYSDRLLSGPQRRQNRPIRSPKSTCSKPKDEPSAAMSPRPRCLAHGIASGGLPTGQKLALFRGSCLALALVLQPGGFQAADHVCGLAVWIVGHAAISQRASTCRSCCCPLGFLPCQPAGRCFACLVGSEKLRQRPGRRLARPGPSVGAGLVMSASLESTRPRLLADPFALAAHRGGCSSLLLTRRCHELMRGTAQACVGPPLLLEVEWFMSMCFHLQR